MLQPDLDRFRLLAQATGDAICDWDIVRDRSWLSESWQRLYGPMHGDKLDTPTWLEMVHPEDRLRIESELSAALAGDDSYWIGEFRFRRAQGGYAHILERACILRDGAGRATRLVAAMTDLSEHKHTEEALRESRRQLATLMSNLPGMAYRCHNEPSWRMIFVSEGAAALTGHSVEALLPGGDVDFAELIHPEDRDAVWRQVQLALRDQRSFAITYRITTADDQVKWCWEQGRGVIDAVTGDPLIEGFIADISAQRAAEQALRESREHYRQLAESNRRLLSEVNHRVRNNLASLLGLVHLTRGEARTLDEFAEALNHRLSAMAQAHGLLADAAWQDLDLRTLIESIHSPAHPRSKRGETLQLAGPAVRVTPRQSVPLAMTFMEMMTNSSKHGALSVRGGRVEVTWGVEAGDLRVRWREWSGPPVTPPITPSLGTELIEGFIRHELGGRCELRYPASGADHLLEIPMGRVQAGSRSDKG